MAGSSQLRSILALTFCLATALAPAQNVDEEASQLSALLSSDADALFPKAVSPREFVFPDDHGPHPEYRNEWWYVTGNLDAENRRRFGFELTFFRFSLTPVAPDADSRWRTNQVYIAHLALTDVDANRFHVAERYSRGALGLAGARAEPFRVWIDDWQIAESGGSWRLRAADEEFGIDVTLVALKPPALNGVDGLSQKSAEPGNASYYYSITRLDTQGHIRVGEDRFAVSGLSWLDREWSSSALASDQVGWDWFALQLSDGSDLMFYSIRKRDGRQDSRSAGTLVAPDGSARHLSREEVELTVEATWESPEGGTYPSAWSVRVPEQRLKLKVVPVIENQELFTTVRYWEGAVDVSGERDGAAVTGRGYVELTGYAE